MPVPTLIEFAILACALLAGVIIGFVISTTDSIWRRRFEQERDYYRLYRRETDALNSQKSRRIADLEQQVAVLRRDLPLRQPVLEPTTSTITPLALAGAVAAAEPAPEEPLSLHADAPAAVPDPAPAEMAWDAEEAPVAAEDHGAEPPATDPPAWTLPVAEDTAPSEAPSPAEDTSSPHAPVAVDAIMPAPVEAPQAESAFEVAPPPEEPSIAPVVAVAPPPAPTPWLPIDTRPTLAPLAIYTVPVEPAEEAPLAASPPVEVGHEPTAEASADAAPAPTSLLSIRGVDEAIAAKLGDAGIRDPQDVEALSAEDEASLEARLGLEPGTIARGEWRLQAALLGAGEEARHVERAGVTEPA